MTWVTSYSGNSTVNVGPAKAAAGDSGIFTLKELMKSVGWTVKSSGDATTYNSTGDQITHSGTGAGGYGNNGSWFRIQDPAVLREYVFQRGTDGRYLKAMYSASDKFTGGTPGASTPPTATDEQGFSRALTTTQNVFSTTAAQQYFHMAAQDTPHNGVYAWWFAQTVSGVQPDINAFLACEPMDDSFSVNDNDPCLHIGTDDCPTYSTLCATSTTVADRALAWMRYGEVDEEWGALSGSYYYNAGASYPVIGSPNPHTGKPHLMSIPYIRHSTNGSIVGFKGFGKYLRYKMVAYQKYPLVLEASPDNYLVYLDFCLPGWPTGVVPVL